MCTACAAGKQPGWPGAWPCVQVWAWVRVGGSGQLPKHATCELVCVLNALRVRLCMHSHGSSQGGGVCRGLGMAGGESQRSLPAAPTNLRHHPHAPFPPLPPPLLSCLQHEPSSELLEELLTAAEERVVVQQQEVLTLGSLVKLAWGLAFFGLYKWVVGPVVCWPGARQDPSRNCFTNSSTTLDNALLGKLLGT